MKPSEVPTDLLDAACDQMYGTPPDPGDDRDAMALALAAVLPEHERQVRAQVAAEIAEPSMWADPTGRWTAEQADAARAMKDHIVRRIARGGA